MNGEQKADTQLWAPASAIVLIAIVSVAAAAGVHHACFHPPPPVTLPDPGTARGKYCSAVLPTHPWLSLTLAPTLLAGLLSWPLRRHFWLLGALVLLIGTAVVVNAVIANGLNAAQTI